MPNKNIMFSAGAVLTIGTPISIEESTSAAQPRRVTATSLVRPCVNWLSRWQDDALTIFAALADTPASWRDMLPSGLPVSEYADSSLGADLWDILRRNHHLAVFAYFHKHPVLDVDERRRYEELLSDREIFDEMRQRLMFPGESQAVMRGCIEWFLRMDYLDAALVWEDNPGRHELLDLMAEIIVHNSFHPEMDENLTQALTTIKLELVQLLFRHSPARVAWVLDIVRGTSMAALIEFFMEHITMTGQSFQVEVDGVPEALAFMETAGRNVPLPDSQIAPLASSVDYHGDDHLDDAVPVPLDSWCDTPRKFQCERIGYPCQRSHGSLASAQV